MMQATVDELALILVLFVNVSVIVGFFMKLSARLTKLEVNQEHMSNDVEAIKQSLLNGDKP